MIKAFIFDYSDVIGGGIIPYLRGMYPDSSEKILNKFINEFDMGTVDYKGMLMEIGKTTSQSVEVIDKNIRDISKKFHNDDRLLDLILDLRNKGYKTSLLSNAGPGLLDINFPKDQQIKFFDDSVLSCDVHLTKPDPKIYELAANRIGVDVSECVFIDDSQRNIDGANLVGMKGILYSGYDEFIKIILAMVE